MNHVSRQGFIGAAGVLAQTARSYARVVGANDGFRWGRSGAVIARRAIARC